MNMQQVILNKKISDMTTQINSLINEKNDHVSSLDHMNHYLIIQNFINQLNDFEKNMHLYIDKKLTELLRVNDIGDLYLSDIDFVYKDITQLDVAIVSFCSLELSKEEQLKKYSDRLLEELISFKDFWFMRKKDKNNKFLDDSSRFMTLFNERKKVMNFDERIQHRREYFSKIKNYEKNYS